MAYTFQACSDISIAPLILGGAPSSVITTPAIDALGEFPPTPSSVGLSIAPTTGIISGNVSTYHAGPKGYIVTASNLVGLAQTTITINTTPDAPDFTVDDFISYRGITKTHSINLNSCFNYIKWLNAASSSNS